MSDHKEIPKKEKNSIISIDDTPEYKSIKELASKDIGQALLDSINEFLEDKKEKSGHSDDQSELKKIIFDDPTNILDQNLHGIMDSFIRLSSGTKLSNIAKKSLDDVLILFNKWTNLNSVHDSTDILENLDEISLVSHESKGEILEEEVRITNLAVKPMEIYQNFKHLIPNIQEIYSNTQNIHLIPEIKQMYHRKEEYEAPKGQFTVGHDEDRHNEYTKKAVYKSH
jgi:hypothetical protein